MQFLFFNYLGDNGLFFVETLLGSGLQNATGRTAEVARHLFAVGFGGIFQRSFGLFGTHFSRPFGTFLLGGVALSDVFAFFVLHCCTLYHIIVNFVFMVSRQKNRVLLDKNI